MKPNWTGEKTSVPLEDLSVKSSSLEHLKKFTPLSKSPVKLNENDQLFKTIESNSTETECSLGILIRRLNIPDSKLKSDDNGNCNSDSDNVENAGNMYNKSSKLITKRSFTKNNLRVTIIQKNLKRRVFDFNGNKDGDSSITIEQSKSTQKLSLIQTSNTVSSYKKGSTGAVYKTKSVVRDVLENNKCIE